MELVKPMMGILTLVIQVFVQRGFQMMFIRGICTPLVALQFLLMETPYTWLNANMREKLE